jgi:hypothetical protein
MLYGARVRTRARMRMRVRMMRACKVLVWVGGRG